MEAVLVKVFGFRLTMVTFHSSALPVDPWMELPAPDVGSAEVAKAERGMAPKYAFAVPVCVQPLLIVTDDCPEPLELERIENPYSLAEVVVKLRLKLVENPEVCKFA
jgi:hypothetical protein